MKRTVNRWAGFLLVAVLLLAGCAEQTAGSYERTYELGIQYLSQGEYEEAVIAFTQAVEIDPRNPLAYVGRGDAYAALEAYGEAAGDYEAALELDTASAETYEKLSLAYLAMGDGNGALWLLEQARQSLDADAVPALLDGFSSFKALEGRLTEEGEEGVMALMEGGWVEALTDLLAPGDRIYTGELSPDGVPEGIGTALYWNGFVYQGEWLEGQRSGRGTWVAVADPEDPETTFYRYDGIWQGDLPNGQGTELRLRGEDSAANIMRWEAEGGYRDGLQHGEIRLRWTNKSGEEIRWSPITAVDGVWQHNPDADRGVGPAESGYRVAFELDDVNSSLVTHGQAYQVPGLQRAQQGEAAS